MTPPAAAPTAAPSSHHEHVHVDLTRDVDGASFRRLLADADRAHIAGDVDTALAACAAAHRLAVRIRTRVALRRHTAAGGLL